MTFYVFDKLLNSVSCPDISPMVISASLRSRDSFIGSLVIKYRLLLAGTVGLLSLLTKATGILLGASTKSQTYLFLSSLRARQGQKKENRVSQGLFKEDMAGRTVSIPPYST